MEAVRLYDVFLSSDVLTSSGFLTTIRGEKSKGVFIYGRAFDRHVG